jgi:hypothetical protein
MRIPEQSGVAVGVTVAVGMGVEVEVAGGVGVMGGVGVEIVVGGRVIVGVLVGRAPVQMLSPQPAENTSTIVNRAITAF